jgi:hypothetical protein
MKTKKSYKPDEIDLLLKGYQLHTAVDKLPELMKEKELEGFWEIADQLTQQTDVYNYLTVELLNALEGSMYLQLTEKEAKIVLLAIMFKDCFSDFVVFNTSLKKSICTEDVVEVKKLITFIKNGKYAKPTTDSKKLIVDNLKMWPLLLPNTYVQKQITKFKDLNEFVFQTSKHTFVYEIGQFLSHLPLTRWSKMKCLNLNLMANKPPLLEQLKKSI